MPLVGVASIQGLTCNDLNNGNPGCAAPRQFAARRGVLAGIVQEDRPMGRCGRGTVWHEAWFRVERWGRYWPLVSSKPGAWEMPGS
jgi:hypothetical protein